MIDKKQALIISTLLLVIVILFGIATLFDVGWLDCMFSIGFHICCIPIILVLIRNPLKKGFPNYVNIITLLLAVLMAIEHTLNFVRELLFGYHIFFSPLFLTAYVIIFFSFDCKERKRSTRAKIITFAITIPLLLLFVCMEASTFLG